MWAVYAPLYELAEQKTTERETPPDGFFSIFLLGSTLYPRDLFLRQVPVGAIDRVVPRVIIPTETFRDGIPLCHCPLKDNRSQSSARDKYIPIELAYARGDRDRSQTGTTVKGIPAEFRHTCLKCHRP